MTLARRRFLQFAAGAAALSMMSRVSSAADYPTRPVHIIVGLPAGTATDTIARLLSERLSKRLGQPVIIDNRAGASTSIATEAVVRASPDGYTLLLANVVNATNATFHPNLNFDFIRDIAPVSSIARAAFVMEVTPSLPAKTVPEFIAYAKANPRRLMMASGGNGTMNHVAGELFKTMAVIDLVHVPYSRGNPMPDLLSGQVQVYFGPIPGSIGFIRDGTLRALAVTTATRSDALPDIPAVSEFLPGYEASAWYGIGAPKGTPAEIVSRLNKEINASLADPTFKARLADLASTALPGSPDDFGKLIASDTEKWANVIRTAGIKPE